MNTKKFFIIRAEKNIKASFGIVLLAAGGSSRLGQPKQLLPYKGGNLLQHAIQEATASKAHATVVVLGAGAALLQKEVQNPMVHVVVNEAWEEGMAASIRCGLQALLEKSPSVQGMVLMMCDQPYVTAAILDELMAAHQATGQPILACSYADTFGPPVFFHHSVFKELLQLKGDMGARNIIRQHTAEVATIPFPEGNWDVDTEADYQKLSKGHSAL